jgi:hypothetical protein
MRLMEPHGICGRKGVGNFECVEKNSLFRIWKNDKEWTMTSISTSFNAEDMWGLDSFEPHQLASTFPSPGGRRASTPRACQTRALRPTATAPSYRGAHRWSEIGAFRGHCDGMRDGPWQYLAVFMGKLAAMIFSMGFGTPNFETIPFFGGWWRTIINVGSTESTQILHCYPRLLFVRNSVGLECPLLTHTWLLAIWHICLLLYIYIYILVVFGATCHVLSIANRCSKLPLPLNFVPRNQPKSKPGAGLQDMFIICIIAPSLFFESN